MGRGPQNFLDRLNHSLSKLDLPSFVIINPHPHSLKLLSNKLVVKVGRLDGAIYYKTTPENLFNLIYQRRGFKSKFVKNIPSSVSNYFKSPLNFYLNRSNRAVLKKSDVLVYQSHFSKNMQDKFVFQSQKPNEIILNGIPREIFYPLSNSAINENALNLVITASFRLHKRLQDAIDLINNLSKKRQNVLLHVIGGMDNLTKDLIENKNTNNCVFYGRVETNTLPMLYKDFDIGLSPSLFDPCPNSVVEMMGCGLPVISTTQSGAAELINCHDLLVEEDCELDYLELQTSGKIPKINLEAWEKTVELVFEKKKFYRDLMLTRVQEELDINLTADRYAKLILESYHS